MVAEEWGMDPFDPAHKTMMERSMLFARCKLHIELVDLKRGLKASAPRWLRRVLRWNPK
jgi:hypothetical protein